MRDSLKRSRNPLLVPLTTVALLSACAGDRDAATKSAGESTVDSTAAPSSVRMNGMDGMEGGDSAGGMMGGMGGMGPEMQAHMQGMMNGMSGEQMKAMLPTHRPMVANMLSRMNGEMRQMHMAADAGWTATVDSLRQDLVRLPDLGGAALTSAMPAHMARVRRLSEMHQRMMGNPKQ